LTVHRVKVTFLVDSEAEVSVIQSKVIPEAPRTTKCLKTIGASGMPSFEPVSDLLSVSFGDYRGEHQFLLSDVCPVNLLGRDLMCALSIDVHCNPTGIKATSVIAGLYHVRTVHTHIHGVRLMPLTVEEEALLSTVPECLWAKSKFDFGDIKGATPVRVQAKSTFRPCKRQYPLSPEAVAGIAPVIQALIDQDAIVECPNSPCNSPILPVKKPNGSWRPVQDLRGINEAVQHLAPTVPNVTTLMSQVPSGACWFTVIDLANAYFSIPVHPDSQFWFAFTFNGKRYTWTRMPQGYASSPTLFSITVAENLSHWQPPCGSTLVQYVDDLLVCSVTREDCQRDTVSLFCFLADNGHKVSKDKVQLVSQSVRYLGHIITPEGRKLGPDRIQFIRKHPGEPQNTLCLPSS
uniref:ribonuclease H n=1 Tax=Dicentrarchus labrax TaxID=13489 RepID=A0A8P4KCS4_DICLA